MSEESSHAVHQIATLLPGFTTVAMMIAAVYIARAAGHSGLEVGLAALVVFVISIVHGASYAIAEWVVENV